MARAPCPNLGSVLEDFPARLADLLETLAARVRAVTVDPLVRAIRFTTLGLVAASLGILALVFLLLALYGALAIPLGNDGAFAVLGSLALIGGIVFWSKRIKDVQ